MSTPLLPINILLALVDPRDMVPVVPVAVPTSRVMLPEFDVTPRASPVLMSTASELVEAALVSELATLADTNAYGTLVS